MVPTSVSRRLRQLLAIGVVTQVMAFSCSTDRKEPAPAPTHEALVSYLRKYLTDPILGEEKSTRFTAARRDLNGDGRFEVIVFVSGEGWCGSGGCMTLILSPAQGSFKLVAKVTHSRPPIRVLANRSYGWHSLGVWVQGGAS